MEQLTKEEIRTLGDALAPICEKRASVSGAFVEVAATTIATFIEEKILPQITPPPHNKQ